MTVNLPPNVRFALYLITSIGSLVVTYLVTKDVLGDAEVALWAGFTALVAGMAGFNTRPGTADNP